MTIAYVHIGHGKTGSSAIQSFFSYRTDLLGEYGIKYFGNLESETKVTSGDYKICANFFRNPQKYEIRQNLFFTSELLIYHFSKKEIRKQVLTCIEKGYLSEIKFLVFTRNPIGYLKSSYLQQIKGSGYSDNFIEYYNNNNPSKIYEHLSNFLQLYKNDDMVKINLYNYDYHKENLIPLTVNFLDINNIESKLIKKTDINNRSINKIEASTMRGFNNVFKINNNRNKIDFDYIESWGEPYSFPELNKNVIRNIEMDILPYLDIINHFLPTGEAINKNIEITNMNFENHEINCNVIFGKMIGIMFLVEQFDLMFHVGEKNSNANKKIKELIDMINIDIEIINERQIFLISRCLIHFGFFDIAINLINKGIERNPYYDENYMLRSRYYFHIGDGITALNDINIALKRSPENVSYQKWKEHIINSDILMPISHSLL